MASTPAESHANLGDDTSAASEEDSVTLVQVEPTTGQGVTKPTKPTIRRAESDPYGGYQRQRAAPPRQVKFSASTQTHAGQFLEAVKAYQHTSNDPRVKSLNLNGTHSWAEVIRLVKDNEAAYLNAGRKPWRRIGRFLGSKAGFVLPWLRLIPNDFNASIAVVHLEEAREDIISTLLRVPEIILQAEHKLETFDDDLALYDKAEELYVAILRALESAIDWLNQNSFGKQGRALMRGQFYNEQFKERVDLLEKALISLQERADVLRDRIITNTARTAHNIEEVVTRVEITGKNIDSTSKATLSRVESIGKDTIGLKFATEHTDRQLYTMVKGIETFTLKQGAIDGKIDDLRHVQQATHEHVESLNDVQYAREQAEKALALATKTAKWRCNAERKIRRMEKQIKGFREANYGITEADLLEILDIDEEGIISDSRIIHQRCQGVEAADYQVAKGIYQGPRFSEWLTDGDSAAIFLESSGSATLSKADKSGFTSGRRYRDQLLSRNLSFLCDCFANLLKQLPPEVVLFCIIDGIDCFEKHIWAEDCQRMMRDLQDIVHEGESYPVFKLLVTSPLRSRYAGPTFAAENRMQILEPGSAGRDNPTERDISMGTRRPKAKENASFRSLREEFPKVSDDLSDSGCSWASSDN